MLEEVRHGELFLDPQAFYSTLCAGGSVADFLSKRPFALCPFWELYSLLPLACVVRTALVNYVGKHTEGIVLHQARLGHSQS